MIDLQLPHPLLDPSRWPAGDALMSIMSIKHGGAFFSRRGRAFVVPETFWIREANDEPSLVSVLRDAGLSNLEIVSKAGLSRADQDEWRAVGATQFRVDASLKIPTLSEWSREAFPRAFHEAGEVNWLRELRDYESQLPDGVPSLDQLRFWPAFLRSRKQFFAPTASAEWAFVQALFSPQDDARGEGPTALLNPTLQVVTDHKEMTAHWRVEGSLHSSALTWQQAAVIDEMRETPRMPRTALEAELAARKFALVNQSSFESVIDQFIDTGLILLR